MLKPRIRDKKIINMFHVCDIPFSKIWRYKRKKRQSTPAFVLAQSCFLAQFTTANDVEVLHTSQLSHDGLFDL
ncbi:hypothetical protein PoB_004409100 [Plakobranchus ocellatus]|uniref:Uncharacterized protein n=1 Tax=Plakobranchus ocellatus TaxID=259542 RepID=A0AAV4BAZ6_9GAST|nr:hypothetical protein PoB_004409100 [Plakobranchus ocellatus]